MKTEEQIATKKRFAGEAKPSMKRRDDHHDYRDRRIYLITLAVEGRRPLLGRLVGNPLTEPGSPAYPHVELTPIGDAVSKAWYAIPRYHPQIEIFALQVMPDHIHGILFVKEFMPEGLGKAILGFKQGCNKAYRALLAQPLPTANQAAPANSSSADQAAPMPLSVDQAAPALSSDAQAAHALPSVMQAAVLQQPTPTPSSPSLISDRSHGLLFERGYNDSILLRDGQLAAMKRYLAENPFRLAMKRARPDLLRVRLDVDVCGTRCSAVGNLALLSAPQKLRVRISRSIAPQLLEQEKARFLAAARAGAVLVSPAISPGEKAITRAAFDEGLPLIVLLDNGLDPMSKPSGERFRACSEGRLLLLSPFPHRNQRITITRQVCEALNGLAWEISGGK